MGSGSKRNISDRPQIRLQQQKGGDGGVKEKIPVCPAGFRTRLPADSLLFEGAPLSLIKQDDDRIVVYGGGKELKTLSQTENRSILPCLSYGFIYKGIVKKIKEQLYGQFVRTS